MQSANETNVRRYLAAYPRERGLKVFDDRFKEIKQGSEVSGNKNKIGRGVFRIIHCIIPLKKLPEIYTALPVVNYSSVGDQIVQTTPEDWKTAKMKRIYSLRKIRCSRYCISFR